MLIPWGVITSHISGMMNKICWHLTNIALVIDAIHEKVIKEERSHI